ncbi:hypothetical protein SRB5_41470 [Streptomyces sp. RB5]|uniref:NAD(P)-binding domain-containing protein n=1 Tax=Streptomyces smaragdinus TaxID=2585196 RepID=A0A7K0CKI5_9ACTN|nr:NAD(P)H-binding protein [Streptomyces smaragdinus]MQY13987.1 hypothetical protein [Streptomyces smaragdinus]
MRIAVAGGTGVAGRLVVAALKSRGYAPVVLSRGQGVDLVTGAGLDAALAGTEAVIDVSNLSTMNKKEAIAFFDKAGHNLLGAAERAGVRHLVTVSIVGVDRVRNGYYAGKMRQEDIVRGGAVPWTILRSTQFHEFAGQVLAGVPGPIAVVPTGQVQPIAVREVAEALVGLALDAPRGMAPEIAGPKVESLVGMARRLMAAGGARKRPVLPVHFPGGMSSGGLLPTGQGPRGRVTFDEWLKEAGSTTAA